MELNYINFLEDGSDYSLSLTKLTGMKIVDVVGYITKEFHDPVFEITRIIFEDGTQVTIGGEHDIAYLESGYKSNPPNLDDEAMEELYKQANGDEDDEEEEFDE